MAVARAQAAAGGSGGLKMAAIAFAVVAVAAATFAVIFLTQNGDLKAAAENAKNKASQEMKSANQARNSLRMIAQELTGEETDDEAQIRNSLASVRETVSEGEIASADASITDMMEALYQTYTQAKQSLEDLQTRFDDLSKERDSAISSAESQAKSFEERVNALQKKYDELAKQADQFRQETAAAMNQLQDDRQTELAAVTAELDQERQLREKSDTALANEQDRNRKLVAQLASFKSSGERGSVLQIKDGTVIRTVRRSDVLYIDLGKSDGVRPGMTFSIYSPIRGIPANGKGKATIEVMSVFDVTSECKITSRVENDPILQGDIIANPVFDRNRQFLFVVAGDFDLNFDGKIDDPAGLQVTGLIERWGGKVGKTVDTRTDFVVLGAAPEPPAKPLKKANGDAENGEPDPAATERANEIAKQKDAFDAVKKEATTLSIPILTRTQFLHYLGYGVPKNTKDDSL